MVLNAILRVKKLIFILTVRRDGVREDERTIERESARKQEEEEITFPRNL